MRHKKLFIVLTILMSAAIVSTVVLNQTTAPTDSPRPPRGDADSKTGSSSPAEGGRQTSPLTEGQRGGMLTGVSTEVPSLDSMPILTSLPWTRSEAMRSYNRAGTARSCDMFASGMATFQPLRTVRPKVASPLGRESVFSVSLTMDTAVREGLPSMSKGKIVSYLEDHVLILQSRLYHDEEGQVFFGDRLGAAFCASDDPKTTIKPQPMIGKAVGEFRTLGLYAPSDSEEAKTDHRTLVLAFQYSADRGALITGTAKVAKEYELIFIHMIDGEPVVFLTSDGRTKFHELEKPTPNSLIQSPSIVATVRFDDFKFFGLYPTKPVVTGISPRARLSLPVESIRSRLLGLGSKEPMSLGTVLDELHAEPAAAGSEGEPTL